MKKKIIALVVIVVLAGACIYLNTLTPIITGYAAKNLASGVFVAGRTQASIEATDLNFSFISKTSNTVDFENKTVSSRFLWAKSTAIYTQGAGCVLLRDVSAEEVQSHHYAQIAYPVNPDTIAWPMGNVVADTIPAGIDTSMLNETLELAFSDTVPFKGVFATTVVYKGQIIAEKYKEGFNADTKFLSWSMAKSFTNALVGILTKTGGIDIDASCDIPEWKDDERSNISISNLMRMNSGLEWNEDYGNNSDVNKMLFKQANMGMFTLNKPAIYPPDSVWVYSSGATNLVSLLIRKKFNDDKAYYEFPYKALFYKIGMTSAVFEVDPSGTYIGSSYIYATMRDYARFGLFCLNQGNWMGDQILPEGWIDYSVEPANGSDGKYGAFFWINQSGADYPDVPRDMFCCRGHDGQYIYMVPSKDLVVVRTGFSKNDDFDYNRFLAAICESIE